MLYVIFHIHSDPLSQLHLHCQVYQQTLSVNPQVTPGEVHLLIWAAQATHWIFYYFYSFTHFPSVSPN